MKKIVQNAFAVYFLRLTALLFVYPVSGGISKYILKNDIYQIKLFTFLSFWYYSIAQVIYSAFWTLLFYIGSRLIKPNLGAISKVCIVSFAIFLVETFLTYQHDILKNKTFFSVKIFEASFYGYVINQILAFFAFLYLYNSPGKEMIKRPSVLP